MKEAGMAEKETRPAAMLPDGEIAVHGVAFMLCDPCLDGAGGECHVPGCAMWLNRAPDLPLRDKLIGPCPANVAAMLDEFESHPNAARQVPLSLWHTLLAEEHGELAEALEDGTPAEVARECADVVYVVYGIARRYGIDLGVALREVHAAAMRKMDANVRRGDGKIIKPPGFVPPDMSAALSEVGGPDA